jgi:DNA-binding MarR family transcriptional regulator
MGGQHAGGAAAYTSRAEGWPSFATTGGEIMTLDYILIPIQILTLKGYSLSKKILLSLVSSFNEKGLRMSNDDLAEILDVRPTWISELLCDLESTGDVEIKNRQSRHRVIYLRQNSKVGDILLSTKTESKKVLLSTLTGSTFDKSRNITKELNNNSRPNSDEFRLAELLLNLILERKSDFKKPNLQTWVIHIERMIRLDKRTPERIEAVIRWVQKDLFWQANILSTAKLREKFDQLELKMKGTKQSEPTTTPLFRCRDGRTPREREMAKLGAKL